MVSRISNMTLIKMGAIGGVLTVSMGFIFRNKIDSNIKQTVYYKEALHTVRTNRGAVYLLGEPIKDGRIDVNNQEENFTKRDTAQYQVPVYGSKQKGTVHFWAKKEEEEHPWRVHRIELALSQEPNRRLLIKTD